MHIICPHCTTSYAIDLATLGVAGRTVRCSRCKEVWLARPEEAVDMAAAALAMADADNPAPPPDDAAAEWDAMARGDDAEGQQIPVVDSPSISADAAQDGDPDWPSAAREDLQDDGAADPRRQSWFRKLLKRPASPRASGKPLIGLPTACAAMGALVLALMIWRVDVVRLL